MTMSMLDLSCRRMLPELMDQPDLDEDLLHHALGGLERINVWSRSVASLWPFLERLARQSDGPLRILDVACGGGDIAVGLWKRARRAGISVDILAVDVSPVAVGYAKNRARSFGSGIRFEQMDVLNAPFAERYDVCLSSLFLHHLRDTEAVGLLAKLAAATRHLLLIDDLRRCRLGYVLAHIACRTLSRSPVVHVDGPRSVSGAFDERELRDIFARAGLPRVRVLRRWPFRMLAEWRPGGCPMHLRSGA
jgi:SAM-dependent methyltransferase